ncbi:MAG: hypothetical protein FWF60_03820 [Oscillospiraceae bacterium]|nr:hypothetical protein [Oscillospiraceae bacterium]
MKLAHQKNKATRLRARELLRGRRAAAAMLLLGGFLLAVGAGLLPLLLDFAVTRAAAALPNHTPMIDTGLRWAKAGGALLLALLAALLCAPLRVGREAWYFGGADGRKRSPARVLFWLQPRWALKAARFVLAVTCCKLLWAALYLLPGGFLLVGTLLQARAGDLSMALFLSAAIGGAALLALGLFFYAATVQRYALVLPVLAKQPRCRLRNAFALSAARTNGSCAALLRFRLGFLPWYLLSLPLLPLFFTAPYIAQCLACRHAELLNGGLEGG